MADKHADRNHKIHTVTESQLDMTKADATLHTPATAAKYCHFCPGPMAAVECWLSNRGVLSVACEQRAENF